MSDELPLKHGIVVNASPLITLFKSGLDFILPELFGSIIVPDAVWQEVSACNDEASEGLTGASWATRKKVRTEGACDSLESRKRRIRGSLIELKKFRLYSCH